MDPQTDFEEGDKVTTRAYINFIRENRDLLDWVVKQYTAQYYFEQPEGKELSEGKIRYESEDNYHGDGETTITVTAINEEEQFNDVMNRLTNMGLEVLEREESQEEANDGTEYMSYIGIVTAPGNINRDWNTPHLLVYGSLSPEVKEACHTVFGNVELAEVPNHYLVIGEEVTRDDKATLADAFSNVQMFDDDREFAQSQASMSDYI